MNVIFVSGNLFSNRKKYTNTIVLDLRELGNLVCTFSFSHYIKVLLREVCGLTKKGILINKVFENKSNIKLTNLLRNLVKPLNITIDENWTFPSSINTYIKSCYKLEDYNYNFTKLMQQIGTIARNEIDENIWVKLIWYYGVKNILSFDYCVLDDLRYKNEYEYIMNKIPNVKYVSVKKVVIPEESRLKYSKLSRKLFDDLISHESEHSINEIDDIITEVIYLN